MKRSLVTTLVLTLCAARLAASENWPQWRGPLQTGTAPDATPPTHWSETQNVKWKVKIPGDGTATPVVWEKMVFVQTAIPTGAKTSSQNAEPANASRLAQNTAAPDGPRGFPPGPAGGPRGFGAGAMLVRPMMRDGDKDHDGKLSRQEFTSLADEWFSKLASDSSVKLDQDKFAERFSTLIGGPPAGGPPNGP